MTVLKSAQAGTLESNDIVITIMPVKVGAGIKIELSSLVLEQYGAQIKDAIEQTVLAYEVQDVFIQAVDRGALDCTIRARTIAALSRAGVVIGEGI